MENQNIIGKWYGSYEIKDLADSDKKTFLGDEYINIILDNGKTELLPKKVIEIVMTETKSDFTDKQDKLFSVIIPQILGIMADYDLTMLDVQSLMNKLDMSLRENYKQAVAKMFDKDDEQMISLMQLQEILTKK